MPGFNACAVVHLQQFKERIELAVHADLCTDQLLILFIHRRW